MEDASGTALVEIEFGSSLETPMRSFGACALLLLATAVLADQSAPVSRLSQKSPGRPAPLILAFADARLDQVARTIASSTEQPAPAGTTTAPQPAELNGSATFDQTGTATFNGTASPPSGQGSPIPVTGKMMVTGTVNLAPATPAMPAPIAFNVYRYQFTKGKTTPVLFATGSLQIETTRQGRQVVLSFRTTNNTLCLQSEFSLLNQACYHITYNSTRTPALKPQAKFADTYSAPTADKNGNCKEGLLAVRFRVFNKDYLEHGNKLSVRISVCCAGLNPDCKYSCFGDGLCLEVSGSSKGEDFDPDLIRVCDGYFIACPNHLQINPNEQCSDCPWMVPPIIEPERE
jgi:hypothetical protein